MPFHPRYGTSNSPGTHTIQVEFGQPNSFIGVIHSSVGEGLLAETESSGSSACLCLFQEAHLV